MLNAKVDDGSLLGVERFEIWVKKGFLGVKKCI